MGLWVSPSIYLQFPIPPITRFVKENSRDSSSINFKIYARDTSVIVDSSIKNEKYWLEPCLSRCNIMFHLHKCAGHAAPATRTLPSDCSVSCMVHVQTLVQHTCGSASLILLMFYDDFFSLPLRQLHVAYT